MKEIVAILIKENYKEWNCPICKFNLIYCNHLDKLIKRLTQNEIILILSEYDKFKNKNKEYLKPIYDQVRKRCHFKK